MATLSEMFIPPPPTLAHTRNSRGDLGMFVNPYTCSCTTCHEYLGERRSEMQSPLLHAASAPAPTPTPVSLTGTIPASPTPSEIESYNLLSAIGRAAMSGPTALTRSVTGFHYSPSDEEEEDEEAEPEPPATDLRLSSWMAGTVRLAAPSAKVNVSLSRDELGTIIGALKEHVETLTARQSELNHSNCRSHDEMAAEDMEFDEIDRKLMEIDDILAVLQASAE